MAERSSGRAFRLLLTGGGTGGHLFPAIAAAQELRKRMPDCKVLFVGTKRKMDSTSLSATGFDSCSIVSYGLKGKGLFDLIKAVLALPLSFVQALMHLRRFKPDVVLGVGGYVTGPVIVAARMLDIPTVIHEQNSIPGMANRKLAQIADYVCLSLPLSMEYFPERKITLTGNPVREKILELGSSKKEMREECTILVLGGSQGAHAVNNLVADVFCGPEKHRFAKVSLIHQTGLADEAGIKQRYQKNGIQANVSAFFQNMAELYQQADFCISRAGATTLSELAACGKPALLIPYPHAADNHQEKNAQYYTEGGGAIAFSEQDATAAILTEAVLNIITNPEKMQHMGAAMRNLAYPHAAEKIIDICIEAAATGDDYWQPLVSA